MLVTLEQFELRRRARAVRVSPPHHTSVLYLACVGCRSNLTLTARDRASLLRALGVDASFDRPELRREIDDAIAAEVGVLERPARPSGKRVRLTGRNVTVFLRAATEGVVERLRELAAGDPMVRAREKAMWPSPRATAEGA